MEVSLLTVAALIGEQRGEAKEAVTLGGKVVTWEVFFEGVKGTRFGAIVKAVCILILILVNLGLESYLGSGRNGS